MRIVAFTKYSYEGPSSRYRFYNYHDCLKKNNIKLDIKPLFKKEYFLSKNRLKKALIALKSYLKRIKDIFVIAKIKKYDLVLIEYELLPYFPPIFEKMLHNKNIKYIVDYDDAIFHKYDMGNPVIKFLLKNKISNVIKYANHVIVCNNYLKEYAQRHNKNISMIPTVVLLDKYIEKTKNFKKNSSNFIVGWIGSRTTSKYILDILPVFERLIKQYKDIKFHLVGFDKNLLDNKTLKKLNIKVIPWKEENEIDDILEFDVGIMPLDETPWSKGKCGFKLIQYMSCKKPVIASPVGINTELCSFGNGFLASSLDEWYENILKLYHHKSLSDMGINSFKAVEKKYNHSKNCKKYIELIKGIDIKCVE